MSGVIGTAEELDELLSQLRAVRGDHQWVEVKKARSALPHDLWTSMSAFANSGGGLVMLGVDERKGEFVITGLENPAKTSADLAALCSRAEPPLRPPIETIVHEQGTVVVAQIAPVARTEQPCHFPTFGPVQTTSYVRVGDSDERLTPAEVNDILSARSSADFSRRTAPAGAALAEDAVTAWIGGTGEDRDMALRDFGVTNADEVTLAGWLTLGDAPQRFTPLARVACMSERPADGGQRGTHVEGAIGEILDGVLQWLDQEMGVIQVARRGDLFDDLDVPREALREAVSNALMHRSFSAAADTTSVTVRVTNTTVVITSPGGLNPGLDPRQLGTSALPAPRNYTLVRLCGRLTSPNGARIVEAQASGITRADRRCREAGCAPLLFAINPARFATVGLRGRLDIEGAAKRWPAAADDVDALRVVAFLERLSAVAEEDAGSVLHDVKLDSYLAARLLTPRVPERAATAMARLVDLGVLTEKPTLNGVTWELHGTEQKPDTVAAKAAPVARPAEPEAPAAVHLPGVSGRRRETTAALLLALATSETGELGPRDVNLGVKDRAKRGVFADAVAAGLIEPTTDVEHSPARTYRLTSLGRRHAPRAQGS